ncbi:exonuclease 3'-5' domain-containing protein 2-like [Culicoides brevitarsis]|uniref:exonuclease 3'-5' domain-containing protein 2-like n=1 Tax=Culicoides brevitarsis TaxID=469753 RepID=UPI00307BDAD4
MNERTTKQVTTALIAGGVGVGLVLLLTRYRRDIRSSLSKYLSAKDKTEKFLSNKRIEVVSSPETCRAVINTIKADCKKYPVLGFDTEWVTLNGVRQPIALLQLATADGFCALLRLCCLKEIPVELRDLLEDEDILKVGVSPQNDGKYLSHDYGAGVASTLDLRYMAQEARITPQGLGKMSKSELGIELNKDWRIRASNWEAETLSEHQIEYAAMDAFVGIELFKNFAEIISPKGPFTNHTKHIKHVIDVCERYLEINFKESSSPVTETSSTSSKLLEKSKKSITKEFKRYKQNTLRRPMYDNIHMYAPDGELLCTCDRSKADWYVSKELAVVHTEDPYSIRLTFEPAGRAVGEVGKYYTIAKENRCVVCGREDSLIRKNVVPRDYRIHFTPVMKDHCSHDVVLTCTTCHQFSNMSDFKMRQSLAELCDAPLQDGPNTKLVEVDHLKRLKSASRALLYNGHMIPVDRKKVLEQEILTLLPDEKSVTLELLEEYAEINIYKENDNYVAHGEKVVEYFMNNGGGLINLERMWREHFLKTLKPKFLPELWSVDHNVQRLEIRADEGRIEVEDLITAGLAPELLAQSTPHDSISESSEKSTLVDASSLRDTEITSQEYLTARTFDGFDDETDASLSSFKSLDATLRSPGGDTVYMSDDSDSTLTQPSLDSD